MVSDLKNLTRTVAHVQRELIGDKLNEIKEELSNESQLTKEVSNSSPESSQEKNGKKIELSKTIGKEMASKLSEIPRLSSGNKNKTNQNIGKIYCFFFRRCFETEPNGEEPYRHYCKE